MMRFSPLRFLLFVSLMLTTIAGFAQAKNDTVTPLPVDSTRFRIFHEADFFPDTIYTTRLQLTLDGFQNYHDRQFSPGNLGEAEKVIALPAFSPLGFHWRPQNFHFVGDERIPYYTLRRPYTAIFAMFGQPNELLCDITHSQNITKNWNVAANFQRIRSEGFYLRQNTNDTRLLFSTNYRSKRRRYFLLGNAAIQAFNVAENGDILNDTLFEDLTVLDRKVIGVNLSAAENREHSMHAYVKQWIALGQRHDLPSADSTEHPWMLEPALTIAHSIRASRDSYVYSDKSPSLTYYPNFYRDSALTHDSSRITLIENCIEIQTQHRKFNGGQRKLGFLLGGEHQLIELLNDTISHRGLTNIFAYGRAFTLEAFGPLQASAGGQYVVSGENAGDYSGDASLRWNFDSTFTTRAEVFAETKKQLPDYFFRHFSGNHYRWDNVAMEQMGYSAAGLRYVNPKWRTKFEFRSAFYDKPVYLDPQGLARQYSGSVSALAATLQQDFKIGHLSIDNRVTYTWLPDSVVIRLPQFVTRNSIYYTFDIAKKTSKLQFGLDAFFFTSCYADAWMPVTAQFMLQNDKSIGNYAYFDVFASMKVRSVRFYVKFDHVNSGFMGSRYYLTPHHPYADRALKFGISWVFND